MSPEQSPVKSKFYFLRPSPFPQLYYIGYVGIIISVVQFFTGNHSQAGFFLAISIFILLLRSWSMLNTESMTINDFFAFIPYRRIVVETPQSVLLSEEKINRTLNSRGSTSTVSYIQYKIILISGFEQLTLKEGRNKNALMKKAREIAIAANLELDDRTN
jgi:hypothetical protein